jgi:hypothetical protein
MTDAEWKVFLPLIGFLTGMLAFNMMALRTWAMSLRARPWFTDWRSPSVGVVLRYFVSAAGLSLITVLATLGAWGLFATTLSGQQIPVRGHELRDAVRVVVAYWVVLQMVWLPALDRGTARLFQQGNLNRDTDTE